MDPNLTYPIILNVTLNQPPQDLLSNPAINTLIGVVAGAILAILTYFLTIRADRNRRQYELKNKTYDEARNNLLKWQKISDDTEKLNAERAKTLDRTDLLPEETELNKAFNETADELRVIKLKLKLCNGTEKIQAIIDDYLDEWAQFEPKMATIKKLEDAWVEALKEELSPRWWPF